MAKRICFEPILQRNQYPTELNPQQIAKFIRIEPGEQQSR